MIQSIFYKGRQYTLSDLANMTGINRSTLWARWKTAGEPETIPAEMLTPAVQSRARTILKKKYLTNVGRGRPLKAVCPISQGRPTKMTKAGFEAICASYREDKRTGWPSNRVLPILQQRNCRACRGKTVPAEIEIISSVNCWLTVDSSYGDDPPIPDGPYRDWLVCNALVLLGGKMSVEQYEELRREQKEEKTGMIIGIDPGQTGAIAAIEGGKVIGVLDMPVSPRLHGQGQQVNAIDLRVGLESLLSLRDNPLEGVTVYLEAVSAGTKQGVSSMFRFGEALGIVLGVVGGMGLAIEWITPAVWKRRAGLTGKDKDAARTLAMQLHPEAAGQLTRKKDTGRADAILIARFGGKNK